MQGSNKNKLQEYYQRRHLSLPVYTHIKTENNEWLSTLTLNEGRCFFGNATTKKDADQNAAADALQHLTFETTALAKTDWKFPGCVLVLIDLENSPNYNKVWSNVRWDCSKVVAFVGKLSSHATKDLRSLYPFVQEFHVINSSMKDAVDHAISLRAGCWLESMKHTEYYINSEEGCVYDDAIHIVSRDRFAAALIDVIEQQIPLGVQIIHSVSIDDCFQLLSEKA